MDDKVNTPSDMITLPESPSEFEKTHKVKKKLKTLIKLVQFSNRLMGMVKPATLKSSRKKSLSPGCCKIMDQRGEPYKNPSDFFTEGSDDSHPLSNISIINRYRKITKSDHLIQTPDFIGLFFASIHCETCAHLLPLLSNIQQAAREQNKIFEIIAVCNDSTTDEIVSWFKTQRLHWYGVTAEEPFRLALAYIYSVLAVPQLIVLDHQGYCISRSSVDELHRSGLDVLVAWFS